MIYYSFGTYYVWAACGVTFKGLMGVNTAVVAVVAVEECCVRDVNSGTPLIIHFDRILVFNCSLKDRYLLCN